MFPESLDFRFKRLLFLEDIKVKDLRIGSVRGRWRSLEVSDRSASSFDSSNLSIESFYESTTDLACKRQLATSVSAVLNFVNFSLPSFPFRSSDAKNERA